MSCSDCARAHERLRVAIEVLNNQHRKYAPGETVLEHLERDVREAKEGLWADPQSVPPWEWRKRK